MQTGVVRFQNLYNQLNRYQEILKDFILNADKSVLVRMTVYTSNLPAVVQVHWVIDLRVDLDEVCRCRTVEIL